MENKQQLGLSSPIAYGARTAEACLWSLEGLLLAAQEPLTVERLAQAWEPPLEEATVEVALGQLQQRWNGRAVELREVATGWRFQTVETLQPLLDQLRQRSERVPRYSRAVMETLAIIAYRQPVTRTDIEAIRGVTVATPILKTLEDRGWIEVVGHKESPGRPALYATTSSFLNDLGLKSLSALPALADLDAIQLSPSLSNQLNNLSLEN
jgi:segregation and condensation protein B